MLTEWIANRPRRVLGATFLVLVIAGVLGGPLLGILDSGDDFRDRSSDSARAIERLTGASGEQADNHAVLLLRPGATIQSRAGQIELRRLTAQLREVPGIATVASASDRGGRRFVSRDRRATYLDASLSSKASEDDVRTALEERFGDRRDVTIGGGLFAQEQLGDHISEDLSRAEMLAFPLLILLSLLFFRGPRAAVLPLVVGVTTIFTTFMALRGINEIHALSIFCVNLVIGMGLGLAIDYTLFLLHRYREELARSGPGTEAIRTTLATAGRTVMFSAATVAIALATLLLFPLNFLKSMALGGASVAIIAAIVACLVTPALFALWNVKLAAKGRSEKADARWYSIAQGVMRRPGAIAAVTAVAMVAFALPALRAEWTPVDVGTVPEGLSARTVGDTLARDFPGQDASPLQIAVSAGRDDGQRVRGLAARVSEIPSVQSVGRPRPLDDSTWEIAAVAKGDAAAEPAREAVRAVRDFEGGPPTLVGGQAAAFIDQQDAIGSRLPAAMALLALLTFAVLWLMTNSIVLPIKALLMNVLTVGSALGLLTLVFQDGRLEGLLAYRSDGGIEPTDFLVAATLIFALSTDYGVFLLGRIKEARDAGLPDREAVAAGLSRTGSVVTAAAILLAVAIGAFVTSEVLFIKEIGIATAVGVMIDAFVVRALLVPSLMALLGPWNWWSPKLLRRLHRRVGMREHGGGPVRAILR